MAKFVHLHTHSHYSLLDGLPKIDGLVRYAKELGMDAIALTDHGNLYGAVEFYKKAKAIGIKPILGVEAYVAPGSHTDRSAVNGERYYHLTLLAKNELGWQNLIKLVTRSYLYGFYYKPRIDKELLRRYNAGLIALSGCFGGEISRRLAEEKYDIAKHIALEYRETFGAENFFIEIGHHPGIAGTEKVKERLIALSHDTSIPLVATQDIHYLRREDSEYHDILLAVQTGDKLADPDRLTLKNDDFSMRSPEEMAKEFTNVPEAITNTAIIADRCAVEIELEKIRLPKFETPTGEGAEAYLDSLLSKKIIERYPDKTPEVLERVEMERGIITRMGFADYFLIVQDFVNWAKERGIVVGPGRGSAAGSIVSYVLGITDLDPIKYELIFERFLNPERIQMPDIDIDIADVRRDEVLGYLKERYGDDHVANIITFGTMAARAAIRDVGRALGLSYSFCDQIAKLIPFNMNLERTLKNVAELSDRYTNDESVKKLIDSARKLEGVARHASVHACGIVITEKPLTTYLPLQRSPQDPNVTVTQFEMHAVENLGLLKMDILGLRNLTIIEGATRLINELHGERINAADLPLDDAKTFKLLQSAETTGVFQLESSGMRRYLKELKPTELEDIIAMVALYRPGPMELIPEYVARKHGRKPVTYLHPKLEPILKKTYGIMIYQEQLMSAARVLAGFTLSEADTLRKAVGKKIRKLLLDQREKLIEGCIKNGVSQEIAKKFWSLIEPFDRYGFNRSHAACYAMIAYETAYLKANYPVPFMTSLINAEARDVERIAFLVSETKRMGIDVLPPDINRSGAVFTPESGNILFGLSAIKNVGGNVVTAIIENRSAEGPFENLASFISRVTHSGLNKKSLECLIKCGALDSLGIERSSALASIEDLLRFSSASRREQRDSQIGLFSTPISPHALKLKGTKPATPTERLAWEKELLGLYITDHPLNQHRATIERAKAEPIKTLLENPNERRYIRVAGVISKLQKIVTKTGKPMLFTTVEDVDGSLEVIVFPDTLVKTQSVWRENAVVLLLGKPSRRNGTVQFICDDARTIA